MIIVCPSCEARFELPENVKFTPASKFKCTLCTHTWKPLEEEAKNEDKQIVLEEEGAVEAPAQEAAPAAEEAPKAEEVAQDTPAPEVQEENIEEDALTLEEEPQEEVKEDQEPPEEKPAEEAEKEVAQNPEDIAQDVIQDAAEDVIPELEKEKNLVDELLLPKEKLTPQKAAPKNLSLMAIAFLFTPFLTLLLLIVFHEGVINQIPSASKVYKKIGINYALKPPIAFKVENIQYKNIKTPEGEPLLMVTGELFNKSTRAADVPEVHMIPKKGTPHLAVASIKWDKNFIAPQEKVAFKALMPSDVVPEEGDILRFE